MISAPRWPGGLLAFAIFVAAAITLMVWAIVATPGHSSSHLIVVKRDEDGVSSGSTRAQARREDGGEVVWVWAERSQNSSGDSGRGSDEDGRGDGRSERVYRWTAWGREWAVRVWVDSGFIAPSMLLRHEAAHEARVLPPTTHAHCFHTGVLLGASDSSVALNICNGLRGVIRVGSVVYIIEPLDEEQEKESDRYNNSNNAIDGRLDHIPSQKSVGNGGVDDTDSLESEANYLLFENGVRLHKLTRTASPEVFMPNQGKNSNAFVKDAQNPSFLENHLHDEWSRHQEERNLCDTSTGISYVDSFEGGVHRPHHRTRRFLYSRRYSIEVMVVVDNKMARYHGKHINQYVLTLMSVVALIFRDHSIGNRIDIAVVEVVRPERQSFVPKRAYENSAEASGKSAEEMLKMFCKWQKQGLKYNTNHPRRYDTALLLTRENICRNPWTKSCDTLGLAELGTMCSRHSSCAIVQDNGLSAAFTIAHEIGHLLNMPHDNDDKCSLLRGDDDNSQRMNVMSRMLDHNTLPWVWSNCSRHYLTEFLHGGHGQCLEDEPWTNKMTEEKTEYTLAGELFNATKQCQYVFGKTSRICPYMPTCKRLWCTTSLDEKEGCRTQHMPWADGTSCDENKWCLRGKCSRRDKKIMRKIHGQWGDWLPWSTCSRTCGVGVRRSERLCNSPKPSYGGLYCTGERVRYESCRMRPCSSGSIDFRTQQCQVYNSKNFGLPDIPEDVKWIPKYAGIRREDSCKLFCQVYNSSRTYFQLREKVEDGTPCGPDTYDICVNGECRVAGCDYVLNSTAKADSCGVCNGDNSTCQVTSESLKDPRPYGYSDIVVIPQGAARIDITQRAYHDRPGDDNYLALVDLETGEYLLNGHWIVTPFQKLVEFGGTLLEYTGSNAAAERINSTKPLQKKLLVQILSVGELNPPDVTYSYSKSNLHSNPNYYWRLGEWSNCTEPCFGKRQRTAYCVRADTGLRAHEDLCPSDQRPAPLQESCSHTCPVGWTYKDWSKCKLVGEECARQREVVGCMSSLGNSVEDERCAADQQHTLSQCPREECPSWRYYDWSPCLCSQGDTSGVQQRPYSCQLRERPLQMWECRQLDKPLHIRNCSCWYPEEWNSWCDLEGHDGSDSVGGEMDMPRSANRNLNRIGDEGEGDEPVKCGKGVRRRRVHCGSPADNLPLSDCDAHTKPSEAAPCTVPCPTTTTTTTTTTTPPTPTIITTQTTTTSSTLTTSSSSTIVSSNLDGSSSLSKSKGGKQHNHHNALNPPYQDHKNKINSPWRQHHHHADHHRATWKGGMAIGHGQEANEIPNTLDSSLDERERSSRNDYSDNNLDRSNHHGRSSGERNKESRHHHIQSSQLPDEHHSSEEESNNVVQVYDNTITGSEQLDTNWQTGGWSTCSEDCGGGEKRRQVVCIGAEETCPLEQQPPDTAPCNTHVCTEWSTGDWGHCRPQRRRRCGRGQQERLVVCRDPNGPELHEEHCHAADRPTHVRSCKVPCRGKMRDRRQRYRWRTGEWSPCSEECDRGVKYRNVSCVDGMSQDGGVEVHDEYCLREGLGRPRDRKGCNTQPCPFHWVSSSWSECSEMCSSGVETREVTCHSVNSRGWIDPDPVSRGCKENSKPRSSRKCNLGPCSHGYYWKVKPWRKCQADCGDRGRQRRGVSCVSLTGQRVKRHFCSREHRPRRKQKCRAKPCGYATCMEAREGLRVTVDGEYSLLIGGRNMSIFCYGMNSTNPREYLTLPAGEEGNFAEIYNKILVHPDTCPHNGERRSDCDCYLDESNRSGYTSFSRIRLNTTTLTVNAYDFTFARAVDGTLIPYGEAGDCFSMAECPQGAFSINLAGTLLAVSPRTNWLRQGTKPVHWINRLDDNQRILGRCGGYCGTCAPDPVIGLKLQLRDG